MLSDHEQAAFDDIVRSLGPLNLNQTRSYLMPWWLPPAVAMFYSVLLIAASISFGVEAVFVLGAMSVVASVAWARRRRLFAAATPPIDRPRPFIT